MATLSKQGTETLRFETLKTTYSFRTNGNVLKQDGFGWKLVSFKEGHNSETFLALLNANEAKLSPAFKTYRAAVQREFPISTRWKYISLRDLLFDDIDGIWSGLNDDGIHVDIETLRELHDLFLATKLSNAKEKANQP